VRRSGFEVHQQVVEGFSGGRAGGRRSAQGAVLVNVDGDDPGVDLEFLVDAVEAAEHAGEFTLEGLLGDHLRNASLR
jgi:hypothetical protein